MEHINQDDPQQNCYIHVRIAKAHGALPGFQAAHTLSHAYTGSWRPSILPLEPPFKSCFWLLLAVFFWGGNPGQLKRVWGERLQEHRGFSQFSPMKGGGGTSSVEPRRSLRVGRHGLDGCAGPAIDLGGLASPKKSKCWMGKSPKTNGYWGAGFPLHGNNHLNISKSSIDTLGPKLWGLFLLNCPPCLSPLRLSRLT